MKIGVIDTDGIFNHIFFKGKNIKIIRYNHGINGVKDWNYNFTHSEYICSSILQENPTAEIILVSIIGEEHRKKGVDFIKALYYLIDQNVDIINLSLGIESTYYEELFRACKYAKSNNVLIVASHSNNGNMTYPANFNNVIGVTTKPSESYRLFNYDHENNDIYYNSTLPYISYFHLNQYNLMIGNSFVTAKITGILSNFIGDCNSDDKDLLIDLINSPINKVTKYQDYRDENFIFITNRSKDPLQLKYIGEYPNCKMIIDINEIKYFKADGKNLEGVSLFIDINSCKLSCEIRRKLNSIIKNKWAVYDSVLSRYPHYNFVERLGFYKEGITINQYLF